MVTITNPGQHILKHKHDKLKDLAWSSTGHTFDTDLDVGSHGVVASAVKLNAVTLPTVPVAGTIESDGTDFYFTSASGVRNAVTSVPMPPPASARISQWKDGVSVGNFDNSANWQELSGCTTPRNPLNSSYMWVMSDHPADMIAAVSAANASNQGVWTLTGAATSVDWEDVESQTVGGIHYLYVMDFGNNPSADNSRGTGIDMRIHRVVEPTVTGSNGATSDFVSIDCVFPVTNGPTSRDCEASLIDENGTIYVITKRDAVQKVYSIPHQTTYTGIQTLHYEGAMWPLPATTTYALGSTPCFAVDAAMSPDGTEIIVKNYQNAYLFPRNPATQTVFQALSQAGTAIVGYVGGGGNNPADINSTTAPNAEPQGEGIAFGYDGQDLYSNSEYNTAFGSSATRYPFFKYKRIDKVPTTATFQDGVSPSASYSGTLDTFVDSTAANVNTSYGTLATFTVDTNTGGQETNQKWGLLKFDLSSIPTNATIVGARLDLYIAVEGAGFQFYKMTSDWTESSTYNSINGATLTAYVLANVPEEGRNGSNLATLTGSVRTNMSLATVQSWASAPTSNYGWIIKCSDPNGNGTQFASREATTAAQRPKLTVRYIIEDKVRIRTDYDVVRHTVALGEEAYFTETWNTAPASKIVDMHCVVMEASGVVWSNLNSALASGSMPYMRYDGSNIKVAHQGRSFQAGEVVTLNIVYEK